METIETKYYGVYIVIDGWRHWIKDTNGNEVFTGFNVDNDQVDKFVEIYR